MSRRARSIAVWATRAQLHGTQQHVHGVFSAVSVWMSVCRACVRQRACVLRGGRGSIGFTCKSYQFFRRPPRIAFLRSLYLERTIGAVTLVAQLARGDARRASAPSWCAARNSSVHETLLQTSLQLALGEWNRRIRHGQAQVSPPPESAGAIGWRFFGAFLHHSLALEPPITTYHAILLRRLAYPATLATLAWPAGRSPYVLSRSAPPPPAIAAPMLSAGSLHEKKRTIGLGVQKGRTRIEEFGVRLPPGIELQASR